MSGTEPALTGHQYGKAENRVVRFVKDSPRHEIADLNVTSTLRGDFAPAYLEGDQTAVLPTDTQKQTIYAFAKSKGISSPEQFGLDLARHFVDDTDPVAAARLDIDAYLWNRAVVEGSEHDHTWVRDGTEIRTTAVTVTGKGSEQTAHVVTGLKDLIILKSTGSQFKDFLVDEYTILEPTADRVMATQLLAAWRYSDAALVEGFDFDAAYATARQALVDRFATVHSLALQQTLWHMGSEVLARIPEVVEVRLVAPNKHHFVYDLSPFGLENNGEVFHADDRPYGHIHASVAREDTAAADDAWSWGW